MKFNDKLIKLRKEKGLSQEELGEILEVSRQSVSKWELGQAMPDIEKIRTICKFFDVNFDYLLDEDITEINEEKTILKNKSRKQLKPFIVILFIIFVVYAFFCTSKALMFSYIMAKNNMNNIESYRVKSTTTNKYGSETQSRNIVHKDNMTYIEECYPTYWEDNANRMVFERTWNYDDNIKREQYSIKTLVTYGEDCTEEKDYYSGEGFHKIEGLSFKIVNDIKDEFGIINILNPFKIYKITEDGSIVINRYSDDSKLDKEIYYIDILSGYLVKYENVFFGEGTETKFYFDYRVNDLTDEDLKFDEEIKNEIIAKSEIHTHLIGTLTIYENINSMEIEILDEASQTGLEYLPAVKIEDKSISEKFRSIINDAIVFNMEEYGAGDYFEGCPIITIYTEDDEKIMMTVCDNFSQNEEGSFNNVIAVWENEDASDKNYYKVEEKIEEFITELVK